jgi:hypothetical protein
LRPASVKASLSYDSFGNAASGSAPTRYTYTGREFDAAADLYGTIHALGGLFQKTPKDFELG